MRCTKQRPLTVVVERPADRCHRLQLAPAVAMATIAADRPARQRYRFVPGTADLEQVGLTGGPRGMRYGWRHRGGLRRLKGRRKGQRY